jgi:hypothetical protein
MGFLVGSGLRRVIEIDDRQGGTVHKMHLLACAFHPVAGNLF